MLTEIEAPAQAYAAPAVELVQASSGKRFANYLIDYVFFILIIFFWGVILGIVSPETAQQLGDINGFADRILSLCLYAIVMGLIEGIFKGKSIGKLITGTRAVNEDGSDITFGKALVRGLVRAVPFNGLSALGTPCYPWHDKWTDTYVIDEKETKQYNAQLNGL